MFRRVIALCLFFCFIPTLSFSAPALRFTPLPMQGEGYVRREFYPFIEYLESVIGRDVHFAYRHNNEKVITGLKTDEIDLAFLGPLPFAILTQQDPQIRPLLQFLNSDGSIGYTCSIGVFSGDASPVVGDSFALTRPYSTCGYLMTEEMLRSQGLSLTGQRYEFIGQHPQCALAVIEGKFKACGIKTSIGRQFSHLGLDLIAESPRVPGFVLVANERTMTENEISRIRSALLSLKPLEKKGDAAITKNWGRLIRYGAIPVKAADYQAIFDLFRTMEIPGVKP